MTQQKERIEREKREAEKEKEREQRKKVKKERKESVKRESPEGDRSERKSDLKRRRISSKEGEKLLAKAGLPTRVIDLEESDDEAHQFSPTSQVRRSPRHTRFTTDDYGLSKPRSRLDHVTANPNTDLEDGFEITGSTTLAAPPSSEGEDDFSDPELAELSRKARRAARAQQAQEKKALSSEADVKSGALDASIDSRTGLATPEIHDPAISILITSSIPDTGQLLIRRKMSQPLGKVRIAWCDRWKLPGEMKDQVFLTFCGRRQYDSTTCQRLGLKVDAHGRPFREDGNVDEPNDQVHVEAFTETLFEEMKAEKARQAKANRAESGSYDVDDESDDVEPEAELPKEIKIIIRAKGKEPFKIKVGPVSSSALVGTFQGKLTTSQHHTFAKIAKAAKKSFAFSSEQAVRLEFDGEPMDPDHVVGDTELEDMDNVDMYLES